MCAIEFQNTKDEIPKPHHEDKTLEQKQIGTMFILNWVPTTQLITKILLSYNKYLN